MKNLSLIFGAARFKPLYAFAEYGRSKTAEEAVRIAKLAKASGLCDMIKVEVIGCDRSLLPDPVETLKASETLLEEGFIVLPYTSDDVVLARKLEELGVHAIMPGPLRSVRDKESSIRSTCRSSLNRLRFPLSWMPESVLRKMRHTQWNSVLTGYF